MPLSDLTADVFLALRDAFFDQHMVPRSFMLRAKRNTQDDPLDEHIEVSLSGALVDATCQKSPGPLTSPDLVVYRPTACAGMAREALRDEVSRIVAIEVKKVEGQHLFHAYRLATDVPDDWEPEYLVDPFPRPMRRAVATQARGRFRLPIHPLDDQPRTDATIEVSGAPDSG